MADKYHGRLGGTLDMANDFSDEFIRRLQYFVEDTLEKIFYHIDRLNIKDTGTLRNSIKATVHHNAGGNAALVSFFMTEYATYVEQAVGKYWGVDNDLGKGVGVKSMNISAPAIATRDYGPMTATFNGIAATPNRVRTHRPRPFVMSEIRRNLQRTNWKLLERLGLTMENHLLNSTLDVFDPTKPGNAWERAGYDSINLNLDGRFLMSTI